MARADAVLAQFALVSLAHLAVLSALLALLPPSLVAGGREGALGVYAAVTLVTATMLHRAYPHDRLGLCNVVTHLRATGTAVLAAVVVAGWTGSVQPGWSLLALSLTVLALDGVDGWLARRARLVSAFGAKFDMEIDALFALLLSVLALQTGKVGVAVLALGLARYAYVAAGFVWPWLRGDLPERQSRKTVCVLQLGVLIALLVPWIDGMAAQALALGAAVALLWSFGVDILWLKRHR